MPRVTFRAKGQTTSPKTMPILLVLFVTQEMTEHVSTIS